MDLTSPEVIIAIVAIFVGLVAVIAAVVYLSKRYIKVPPNMVAVISGRKYNGKRRAANGAVENVVLGYRTVSGGATLVVPVLERYEMMSLETQQVPVDIGEVFTKEGVPVQVESTAQVKIKSDPASLNTAAEQLLTKSLSDIAQMASKLLTGHIRNACAQLTVEEINSDRDALAEKIQKQAVPDLERIGLEVTVFVIEDIGDKVGYLESLGKKRTAEVKKDAEIGRANAERDQKIQVAGAQRDAQVAEAEALEKDLKIKKTQSEMEGKVAEAKRAAEVAEAEKERDVKRAQYDALTKTEQSKATAAGKIEDQKQLQAIKEEEAKVRSKQEYIDKVVTAEKAADALAAQAEGEKRKTIINASAEAERIVQIADANAKQTRISAEAEAGRLTAIGAAEASAILAKGKATAEARKLELEALSTNPEIAIAQIMAPVMPQVAEALAKPLTGTEKIVILGGGSEGKDGLDILPNMVSNLAMKVPTLLQAFTGKQPNDLIRELSQAIQGKGGDLQEILEALPEDARKALEAAGLIPAASSQAPPPPSGSAASKA